MATQTEVRSLSELRAFTIPFGWLEDHEFFCMLDERGNPDEDDVWEKYLSYLPKGNAYRENGDDIPTTYSLKTLDYWTLVYSDGEQG